LVWREKKQAWALFLDRWSYEDANVGAHEKRIYIQQ